MQSRIELLSCRFCGHLFSYCDINLSRTTSLSMTTDIEMYFACVFFPSFPKMPLLRN